MATPQDGQQPEDEVVVEIEEASDQVVVETTDAAAAEPAPQPKIVSAEEGVAELRAKLEAERERRETAERGRQDAEGRAAQHQRESATSLSQKVDSEIGQINSAIETLKSQGAVVNRQYEDAMAAGNYAAAGGAQREMARQEAVLQRLEEGKIHREAWKKAPQRQQPQPQPQNAPAPAAADPVEAFVANRPAKTQAWARAHPDFITDPRKFEKLQGAHLLAKGDHAEGTDEYFARVDQILGLKATDASAPEPVQRRAPTVAAPVTRSQPSLSRAPTGQRTIRLTAMEARMAEAQGITPREWAIEKEKQAAAKAAGTEY